MRIVIRSPWDLYHLQSVLLSTYGYRHSGSLNVTSTSSWVQDYATGPSLVEPQVFRRPTLHQRASVTSSLLPGLTYSIQLWFKNLSNLIGLFKDLETTSFSSNELPKISPEDEIREREHSLESLWDMLHWCSLLKNLEGSLRRFLQSSSSLSPNIPSEFQSVSPALLSWLSLAPMSVTSSALLYWSLPSDYGYTGSRFVAPAPPP